MLRPQPTQINSFMSGPSLSLKPDPPREAKLLTVIGLNTKHADCRIYNDIMDADSSNRKLFYPLETDRGGTEEERQNLSG